MPNLQRVPDALVPPPPLRVTFPSIPTDVIPQVVVNVLKNKFNEIAPQNLNQSEDCLTINVFRPPGISSSSKLPVVVWIFGGGFIVGAPNRYKAGMVVERSIQLNKPVVYVSLNYRLNGNS
ncbi:hypothetical protein HGRIS_010568 [Hohenbuehelia grisea]|uniref:Carboxylesterase type B domain-containing protein n=1 Tax=Hohenbuehelia grisea TaxID=104357 RepID=A0ABR3IX84_9AGAR